MKIKALAITMALILLAGCTSPARAEEPAIPLATPVETAFLARTSIRNELTYIGATQPNVTINIASILAAEVTSVNFQVGDTVEQGDVLFTLDAVDLQNQMRQLQAGLQSANVGVEQAQHHLSQVSQGGDTRRLQEMQEDLQLQSSAFSLENAEASRDLAGNDISRFQRANRDRMDEIERERRQIHRDIQDLTRGYNRDVYIFNPNRPERYDPTMGYNYRLLRDQMMFLDLDLAQLAGSLDAMRTNEQALWRGEQQARAALDLAEESYRHSVEQTQVQAEFGVRSAQAQAESLRAQLSSIQTNLNRASVTSPISGVISARNVEVGQMVSQAVMPFTIVQIDPVVVQVSVSETLINLVYPGQQVDVEIQALDSTFAGTISTVAPVANHASTFPVQIELPNPDGQIRPGMFSSVTFVESQSANTFVVARNVVMSDEDGEFVFVVQGGYAQRLNVRTGLEAGNLIEIVAGVSEADEIIVVGQEFLSEGTLVNVVAVNEQRVNG